MDDSAERIRLFKARVKRTTGSSDPVPAVERERSSQKERSYCENRINRDCNKGCSDTDRDERDVDIDDEENLVDVPRSRAERHRSDRRDGMATREKKQTQNTTTREKECSSRFRPQNIFEIAREVNESVDSVFDYCSSSPTPASTRQWNDAEDGINDSRVRSQYFSLSPTSSSVSKSALVNIEAQNRLKARKRINYSNNNNCGSGSTRRKRVNRKGVEQIRKGMFNRGRGSITFKADRSRTASKSTSRISPEYDDTSSEERVSQPDDKTNILVRREREGDSTARHGRNIKRMTEQPGRQGSSLQNGEIASAEEEEVSYSTRKIGYSHKETEKKSRKEGKVQSHRSRHHRRKKHKSKVVSQHSAMSSPIHNFSEEELTVTKEYFENKRLMLQRLLTGERNANSSRAYSKVEATVDRLSSKRIGSRHNLEKPTQQWQETERLIQQIDEGSRRIEEQLSGRGRRRLSLSRKDADTTFPFEEGYVSSADLYMHESNFFGSHFDLPSASRPLQSNRTDATPFTAFFLEDTPYPSDQYGAGQTRRTMIRRAQSPILSPAPIRTSVYEYAALPDGVTTPSPPLDLFTDMDEARMRIFNEWDV